MVARADLDGGYVLIFRRLLDNPVFRNETEAMVFAWMILRAAWKPVGVRYKGHFLNLKRGQLAMSVRDMAERLDWSKDRVSRFLNTLANRDMITTLSATGVNVITICKYDDYQLAVDDPATLPLFKPRQHRDSTATQNKELNEGNEGKREDADASSLSGKAPRRGSSLPDSWKPTMKDKTLAMVEAWPDGMFEFQLEQFTDHHTAKGTLSKDWEASWRTWARNADQWKGRKGYGNGISAAGSDDGPRHGMVRAAASFVAGNDRR